jgi:V/A-type H+-transporting ATPase subunit A
LQRIVKLIGEEALPDPQRLTLEAARWLKEGFLQQSAFDPKDMFCSPRKQMKMLSLLLGVYHQARTVLAQGIPFYQIREIPEMPQLLQMKSRWGEEELDRLDELATTIKERLEALAA